jgi:hypothetical protein
LRRLRNITINFRITRLKMKLFTRIALWWTKFRVFIPSFIVFMPDTSTIGASNLGNVNIGNHWKKSANFLANDFYVIESFVPTALNGKS